MLLLLLFLLLLYLLLTVACCCCCCEVPLQTFGEGEKKQIEMPKERVRVTTKDLHHVMPSRGCALRTYSPLSPAAGSPAAVSPAAGSPAAVSPAAGSPAISPAAQKVMTSMEAVNSEGENRTEGEEGKREEEDEEDEEDEEGCDKGKHDKEWNGIVDEVVDGSKCLVAMMSDVGSSLSPSSESIPPSTINLGVSTLNSSPSHHTPPHTNESHAPHASQIARGQEGEGEEGEEEEMGDGEEGEDAVALTGCSGEGKRGSEEGCGTSREVETRTNLIINYLPPTITQEDMRLLFTNVGQMESCKLIKDKMSGSSLGYGFVNYKTTASALKAIQLFNGLRMQNKAIKVSFARPSSDNIKGANLYVSGLSREITAIHLSQLLGAFGTIITSKVLTDPQTATLYLALKTYDLENNHVSQQKTLKSFLQLFPPQHFMKLGPYIYLGLSKGVGFIRFNLRSEADQAIRALNGTTPPGCSEPITVKFAHQPTNISTKCSSAQSQGIEPTGCVRLLGAVPQHPQLLGSAVYLQTSPQQPQPVFEPTLQQYSFLSTQQHQDKQQEKQHRHQQRQQQQQQQQQQHQQQNRYSRMDSCLPVLSPITLQAYTPHTLHTPGGLALPHQLEGYPCTPSQPLTCKLTPALTPTPSCQAGPCGTEGGVGPPVGGGGGLSVTVLNLPPDIDDNTLWSLFSAYGSVVNIKVVRDGSTGKCKGVASVIMSHYDDCLQASLSLDGYQIDANHVIRVYFKTTNKNVCDIEPQQKFFIPAGGGGFDPQNFYGLNSSATDYGNITTLVGATQLTGPGGLTQTVGLGSLNQPLWGINQTMGGINHTTGGINENVGCTKLPQTPLDVDLMQEYYNNVGYQAASFMGIQPKDYGMPGVGILMPGGGGVGGGVIGRVGGCQSMASGMPQFQLSHYIDGGNGFTNTNCNTAIYAYSIL